MYGVSLILAPFLQFISSFYWINGEYGVTGGTILVMSMVFWIPALIALFDRVKEKMPNYAAWGLLVAIFGFVSGADFAMVGVMSEIFGITHSTYLEGFAKHKLSADILLFQSGPLAPFSLIVLGIVLLRIKSIDAWIAILIIAGGIAFPLSRISRIQWAAHIADTLLLIPLSITGLKLISGKRFNERLLPTLF